MRLGAVGIASKSLAGRTRARRKSRRPAWRGGMIGLLVCALLAALVAAPLAIVGEFHRLLTDNRLFLPVDSILLVAAVTGILIAIGLALLSGLAGAVLGVLLSIVGRFGIGRRELDRVAVWLQPGERAVVLRIRPAELAPVQATLARAGARRLPWARSTVWSGWRRTIASGSFMLTWRSSRGRAIVRLAACSRIFSTPGWAPGSMSSPRESAASMAWRHCAP
jgi:hypothetical protein